MMGSPSVPNIFLRRKNPPTLKAKALPRMSPWHLSGTVSQPAKGTPTPN
jgi:hypothetical protein